MACSVENNVWVGDAEGYIYAFNASDCGHQFSYAVEPAQTCPVVALVYLKRFSRVAKGLENGRLFLLDSNLALSTSVSAEGSLVRSELGSGEQLLSVFFLYKNESECKLWCGEPDGAMNVFSMKNSHDSSQHHLTLDENCVNKDKI